MDIYATSYIYSAIQALLFAAAAGLVGSFSLIKRMLLAGDVISHVALPGFGIALLFGINPLIGSASSLLLGTVTIWGFQKQTGLATENVIGVVFATSLAVGACVTPKEDLVDAFFGNFSAISLSIFIVGVFATLFITLSMIRFKHELVLTLFSEDLAIVTGVNQSQLNLYFLLLFSLTVLIGLRFMGTLLASSLIILPAATARRFTNRMSHFLIVACIISTACVAVGLVLTSLLFLKYGLGPITVLLAAAVFGVSLIRRTS